MLREALDLATDFVGFCVLIATVAALTIGCAAMMGPLP